MNNASYRDLWYGFLFSLGLIAVSFTPLDRVLRQAVFQVTAPLQYGFYSLGTELADEGEFVLRVFELKARLSQLEKENARLKAQLAGLKERLREDEVLRAQFGLSGEAQEDLIFARVIGRGINESESLIKIDRGREAGVVDDAPVIYNRFLVGKVAEVHPRFAFVRLVTDSKLRVAALDEDSPNRARGITRGDYATTMVMEKIFQEEVVKVGDTIITSGEDGFFPKGLVIGYVSEVPDSPRGILKKVKLDSGLDLTRLEEVFVMKRGGDL